VINGIVIRDDAKHYYYRADPKSVVMWDNGGMSIDMITNDEGSIGKTYNVSYNGNNSYVLVHIKK
jgi:hypothetical protein